MSVLNTSELQAWIGRERTLDDELHHFPARALGAAFDQDKLPSAGDELPLAWQWLYFLDTPARVNTGADGHQTVGALVPPAPLPRRMWAAGSIQSERPLLLGQPATRHSVLQAAEVKSGRSGELLFVTVAHTISQGGQIAIRETQNLVYREMPTAFAPLPSGEQAPLAADWRREVHPDSVLLFRYSALTYNSHRIHYDRRYATEKEFYPALVVHAPLLATLILDLVRTELPNEVIKEFQFRAVRPTFDTHAFTVCGKRDGRNLNLWTADHEGYVCVSASARLA